MPLTGWSRAPAPSVPYWRLSGFYLVYFGGFYEALASEHLGHMFMNVHFLLTGFLFALVMIGSDPLPRRPPTACNPTTRRSVATNAPRRRNCRRW